jgi:hypothetical protein
VVVVSVAVVVGSSVGVEVAVGVGVEVAVAVSVEVAVAVSVEVAVAVSVAVDSPDVVVVVPLVAALYGDARSALPDSSIALDGSSDARAADAGPAITESTISPVRTKLISLVPVSDDRLISTEYGRRVIILRYNNIF